MRRHSPLRFICLICLVAAAGANNKLIRSRAVVTARALDSAEKTASGAGKQQASEETKEPEIPDFNVDDMIAALKADAEARLAVMEKDFTSVKETFKKAKEEKNKDLKAVRQKYRACWKDYRKASDDTLKSVEKGPCDDFKKVCDELKDSDCGAAHEKRRDKRKNLRKLKKEMAHGIRMTFREKRSEFRDFRKEMRATKFEANMMPTVVGLIKSDLEEALATADMGGMNMTELGDISFGAPTKKDKKALEKAKATFAHTVRASVSSMSCDLFAWIKKKIWVVVTPVWKVITNGILTILGSAPLIGGVLSTFFRLVFEGVFMFIQSKVEGFVDKFRVILDNWAVDSIVEEYFKVMGKVGNGFAARLKKVNDATKEKFAEAAKKSKEAIEHDPKGEIAFKKAAKEASDETKKEEEEDLEDDEQDIDDELACEADDDEADENETEPETKSKADNKGETEPTKKSGLFKRLGDWAKKSAKSASGWMKKHSKSDTPMKM